MICGVIKLNAFSFLICPATHYEILFFSIYLKQDKLPKKQICPSQTIVNYKPIFANIFLM